MDKYQPVKPSTTGDRVKVGCSHCGTAVWEVDAHADLTKPFTYVCSPCIKKEVTTDEQ